MKQSELRTSVGNLLRTSLEEEKRRGSEKGLMVDVLAYYAQSSRFNPQYNHNQPLIFHSFNTEILPCEITGEKTPKDCNQTLQKIKLIVLYCRLT